MSELTIMLKQAGLSDEIIFYVEGEEQANESEVNSDFFLDTGESVDFVGELTFSELDYGSNEVTING